MLSFFTDGSALSVDGAFYSAKDGAKLDVEPKVKWPAAAPFSATADPNVGCPIVYNA